MNFEKLLLEVNKKLPSDSTVQTSKIKNSTQELPRLLSDMSFNKRFFCKGEKLAVAYGVSFISYESELLEAEIAESGENFKSVISDVFNMNSNFKVEFICSYDEFWEDEEGREHYDPTFDYCLIWSIFR